MSSTNRKSARHEHDHYVTPAYCIVDALNYLMTNEPGFQYTIQHHPILDPCCGGYAKEGIAPPYVKVLHEMGAEDVCWMDIREDSAGQIKGDYLEDGFVNFSVIISNPPFNLAQQFIEKAINEVTPNGYVIMLLRLNFLGSQSRKSFFDQNPPKHIIVHSKRPRFIKGKSGDSCEYAHFVWQKGYSENYSKIVVI